MEAEAAFIVASAGEVVVDRDRSFGRVHLLELMKVVEEVGSETYNARSACDAGDKWTAKEDGR